MVGDDFVAQRIATFEFPGFRCHLGPLVFISLALPVVFAIKALGLAA
jgi:hypothetical protein